MRTACLLLVAAAACHGAAPARPAPPAPWRIPDGWKQEVIPFPLEFAPGLAHRGVEELRFPPGFLKAGEPNRWSYAFVWRLDDAAALDEAALGAELTDYFRGLLVAVDGDQHRVTPDAITAHAIAAGDRFTLTAHILDSFGAAEPVDLIGTAWRTPCGSGALWTFVLAPADTPIRAELEALAAEAACGQPTPRE